MAEYQGYAFLERRFSAQSPTATADTQSFAPFGDVIQIEGSKQFEINSGYTTRVHDLIDIQLDGEDARPQLSFFLGRPRPLEISMLEKHPLGSQAFYPVEQTLVGCRRHRAEGRISSCVLGQWQARRELPPKRLAPPVVGA